MLNFIIMMSGGIIGTCLGIFLVLKILEVYDERQEKKRRKKDIVRISLDGDGKETHFYQDGTKEEKE